MQQRFESLQHRLENINEFLAAGLFEQPGAAPFVQFSRAIRRYLEKRDLPHYDGGPLYPCGSFDTDLCFKYELGYTVMGDWIKLAEKDESVVQDLRDAISGYNWRNTDLLSEYVTAGPVYTHSFVNIRRILKEGLDSYGERIKKMKNNDMRSGLLDVLEGIRAFHTRSLSLLKESNADDALCKALERVPFKPAETLYEAIVCWNFIYYIDGCDNLGWLDEELIGFYKGEDMTDVLRCFFKNVDATDGWSGTIGPFYNPITLQCLRACKGLRKPGIQLRTTPDMPQEIWDAAIDSLLAGGGSPALYNEEAYQNILKDLYPDSPAEDRIRFCGAGCTETMMAGLSHVGSNDSGLNLAWVFERVMRNDLPTAKSFESFYALYIKECHKYLDKLMTDINASQELRAKHRPQPIRTLLTDDCIEKERDFNDGGTRYTGSIITLAGLINVIDSLLVIRKIVFTNKEMSGEEFLEVMDSGETFLSRRDIPRHGTDSEEANEMASRLSEDICSLFDSKTPYSGGKFMPASIQHTSYERSGSRVGATPDGRKPYTPLCDSIGAIHGNDKAGTTALLNSATALCQSKFTGTPIFNIKMTKNHIKNNLKALALGYFQKGGLQMQVTCVSLEDMLDAQKNPEKHPNLIVRIGGYSEYFTRLTPELQKSVIERNTHEM